MMHLLAFRTQLVWELQKNGVAYMFVRNSMSEVVERAVLEICKGCCRMIPYLDEWPLLNFPELFRIMEVLDQTTHSPTNHGG